ncbi:MAG TPA: TRAP transporter small permease [Kofleriaceae bacterium]
MSEAPPGEKADDPPVRESHVSLDVPEESLASHPDDGPFSRTLRKIDAWVGTAELTLLVVIFASVVLVASLSALSGHLAHHQIGQWWNFVVRKGTFAIAMLGAAYATHQQRLLAMDLISRRISPRARLALGMVLKLFTVLIAGVLFDIGMYLHSHADSNVGPTLDLVVGVLNEKKVLLVLPIGMALIIFHSLVHAATDADYLVRNKLPPERARSGH